MKSQSASKPASQPHVNQAGLVVLNGRLRGARRLLRSHVTLIGNSPMCDIRLHIEGVSPMHAVIVRAGDQFVLRDLESPSGTSINGKRISEVILQNGDRMMIGPFSFQVQVPSQPKVDDPHREIDPSAEPHPNPQESLSEAYRIQIAALVAQQATLSEQESQLARQQSTFEKQQAQLGNRLEQKRQKLIELHLRAQESRQSLQNERDAYERRIEEIKHDLTQTEATLFNEKQNVVDQREKLVKLRRRLKKRFDRQASCGRKQIEENEAMLADVYSYLQQQQNQLNEERSNLTQVCLKFNTDLEIGRRRLEEEWHKLNHEKQEFRKNAEKWLDDAVSREEVVSHGERVIHRQTMRFQNWIESLRDEAAGLQNRISNQRRLLQAQEKKSDSLESIRNEIHVHHGEPVPATAHHGGNERDVFPIALILPQEQWIENWIFERRPVAIASTHPVSEHAQQSHQIEEFVILAEEVCDQRNCLMSQMEVFLNQQREWKIERRELCREITRTIQQMRAQTEAVAKKEDEVNANLEELARRHQELVEFRQHLAGWQGRLHVAELDAAAEREKTINDLQSRQEAVAEQSNDLEELRLQWDSQRQKELDALRSEKQAFAKERQELAALKRQHRLLIRKLHQDRRNLSSQTLAAEKFAQRIKRTPRDAAKLERLRARLSNHKSAELTAFEQENAELREDHVQMQKLFEELQQQLTASENEKLKSAERQTQLEHQILTLKAGHSELAHQLQSAQQLHERYESRIRELQDDVEGIANHLLEEPMPPSILLLARQDNKDVLRTSNKKAA